GQLVLFLISNIFQLSPLYVEAGSLKYSNDPLMSVLSARPQEYAATKVAAGSPALIAVDPTHAGLATAVNTAASDVAAASMLDSQTDTEVKLLHPNGKAH
ncbi:unnamed protein product, partial [Ceratitis capitata]